MLTDTHIQTHARKCNTLTLQKEKELNATACLAVEENQIIHPADETKADVAEDDVASGHATYHRLHCAQGQSVLPVLSLKSPTALSPELTWKSKHQ